jgi:hypothetical protein
MARMAEIRLCSRTTEEEIMQVMGVDLAALKNCIMGHLHMKWTTAWKCDRRTFRWAMARMPRAADPMVCRMLLVLLRRATPKA